jgi:hypothetical protein
LTWRLLFAFAFDGPVLAVEKLPLLDVATAPAEASAFATGAGVFG